MCYNPNPRGFVAGDFLTVVDAADSPFSLGGIVEVERIDPRDCNPIHLKGYAGPYGGGWASQRFRRASVSRRPTPFATKTITTYLGTPLDEMDKGKLIELVIDLAKQAGQLDA